MKKLAEEDDGAFKRQFARYIRAGLGADDLAGVYTKAHAGIRAEPFKKRDPLEKGRFGDRKEPKEEKKFEKKNFKAVPISVKSRKARIRQKLMAVGLVPVFDKL